MDLKNDCIYQNWLEDCLPIIIQPKLDIEKGNHLVKILYEFVQDRHKKWNCRLCVIYSGESTYYPKRKEKVNEVATFLYRSYNRKVYARTADIDYLEYKDVDFNRSGSRIPWRSIFTTDHAGTQGWSKGDKGNIFSSVSLMQHYRNTISYDEWQKYQGTHRPLVYVNTYNHMWGEIDNNPDLVKHVWSSYSFQAGDNDHALTFSQRHIPTKSNLYSLCCFCFAKNGGGCCDRINHHESEE